MRGRWPALLFAMVVALNCGGDGSGGDPVGMPTTNPPAPPPPPGPAPPPPPRPPPPPPTRVEPPFGSDANFDIQDDTFVDPDGNHDQEGHVSVRRSATITWTQNGTNIHRVEFSKVPKDAPSPDSKDLRPGTIWEFVPKVEGEYVFFCRYHEYMMDVRITVATP
ncbi:cupredoxin domain-containing protein [Candidatus Palauibacter sp.]|uniref:cupredoxin domain-containing protein n=1 Tax=Candidatus Palauibacter sp. TaxID=3101350 RepID=UPI003AF23977